HADPAVALAAYRRALDLAMDARNGRLEGLARREIVGVQMAALEPRELAEELIGIFGHLRRIVDTGNVYLCLSYTSELLIGSGDAEGAALLHGHGRRGWSGRSGGGRREREVFEAAGRTAMGERWDVLVARGAASNVTQIVDLACERLTQVRDLEE
ncbi:MAG: hypothetical protein AAFZ07_15760, partial [Actinomycetota bacterium]